MVLPASSTQLLWALIILLIIGLIGIVVLGFLFAFPVAVVAAITAWFLTSGDLFLTGLTFLVVALITASIGRIWQTTRRQEQQKTSYESTRQKLDSRLWVN